MRPWPVAATIALTACSPSIRRPVRTTDAATRLEQVTHGDGDERDPAVSPDASAIAYDVTSARDAAAHVEVMSLARGEVLYGSGDVPGAEPAWLPDGSGVVFVSSPRRALMEVRELGGGTAPLIADAGDRFFAGRWPAVSPDGGTILMTLGHVEAFATGWPDTERLDRALASTDVLGHAVTVVGGGSQPAWSPDGRRIAFVRDGHILVANADGSEARAITDGSDRDEQPSWSPGGRRIVFCSAHTTDEGENANLFVVDADGSRLVQLTEGDRIACRPSWGRDGFVYFHANAARRFHVWRLRPR